MKLLDNKPRMSLGEALKQAKLKKQQE